MWSQSTESSGPPAVKSLAIGRICVAPKMAAWVATRRPVDVVADLGRTPLDPVAVGEPSRALESCVSVDDAVDVGAGVEGAVALTLKIAQLGELLRSTPNPACSKLWPPKFATNSSARPEP